MLRIDSGLLFIAIPLGVGPKVSYFPESVPVPDTLISTVILDSFHLISAKVTGVNDEFDSVGNVVFLHVTLPIR